MVLISVDCRIRWAQKYKRVRRLRLQCDVIEGGPLLLVRARTVTCFREKKWRRRGGHFDGSYPAHLSSQGIKRKNRLKILELEEARNPRSGPCNIKNCGKAHSVSILEPELDSSRSEQIKRR